MLPGPVAGPVAQPGVIAQAHVLAALLNGDTLRPAPGWLGALLAVFVFGASILTGLLMVRSILLGVVVAVGGLALVLLVTWLLHSADWVAAPSETLSGLALASLGQLVVIVPIAGIGVIIKNAADVFLG